ncbi:uncharacterized protein BX664DRAFT_275230 [Halteromyces radiatus]|uniref:uncharacterized protein n=1 Tax=Halteromyces radiatus TaxID=101107 RepID=UPI0022205DB9|nr:uncharacterized protein BX664DRAFT_275230 [Halteromyces radiatus]KAI8096863.1 hypothetical protein BX664DRAFT_275230 [Halteromyces radiatus]
MKRKVDNTNENKKRRLGSSLKNNTRYPLSYLFSSIVHRQSPLCLTNSSQGVVVAAPPRPIPSSIHCLSGDLYTLNNSALSSSLTYNIKKVPIRMAENYHKEHTITHLNWNQKGTTLASVDETGKLALWNIENSVDSWSLTYEVDLRQPVAAILWLNADREYAPYRNDDRCEFVRENVFGPRNPFGYLAFIAVTVHGEISVHYQRNGSIFSTFSTTLPKTGHRDTSRADTGCYGMALAGLDDWQRMSHASLVLGKGGDIYLASYYSECVPKTIYLYKISIQFPCKSENGAIFCQSTANLRFNSVPDPYLESISNPEMAITQIKLSHSSDEVMLHVCFGEQDVSTKQYSGYYGKWTLGHITQQIGGNYFDGNTYSDNVIRREQIELKYVSGFALGDRFVTSISCSRSGELALGLSDGSIHMELQKNRSDFHLARYSNDNQTTSLSSNFWQVVGSHMYEDEFFDPVFGICFSPCETHLLHILSSGRIGSARITMDTVTEDNEGGTIKSLEQQMKLSLLNQTDNLDLISEVIRIGQLPGYEDISDQILENVLLAYESFFYQQDLNILQATPESNIIKRNDIEEWTLARTRPAYGLAIGTYRYLSGKRMQFINLTKAIQLPIILECFMGSCTSDLDDMNEVLDFNNKSSKFLSFNPDSLWSLVSLSTWTLDYVRWTLQEWNILFNSRHPKTSGNKDLSSKQTHAVLLVHKESRISLIKILLMIQQFIQYATTSKYELQHMVETKSLLLRHISTTLTSEPVPINDVISFLQALDNIKDLEEAVRNNKSSRWSILISSKLPSGEIMDELKKVTGEYRSKCAVPAIYLETHKDYPIDVIRKKRISNTSGGLQSCIRCRQLYLPTMSDTLDPTSFSSWFHSLTRRCVCGGLFF